MASQDELFQGTSLTSFEEAVVLALPSQTSNAPESFVVVELSVQVGGFVGRPQYRATVRRQVL
jgi:hypothetical protein